MADSDPAIFHHLGEAENDWNFLESDGDVVGGPLSGVDAVHRGAAPFSPRLSPVGI